MRPAPASYSGPLNINGGAKRSTKEFRAWAAANADEAAVYDCAVAAWYEIRDAAWKAYSAP